MSSIVHMHSGAARHPSAGDARVPLEEMRRRFRVDRFEAAETRLEMTWRIRIASLNH